ncbi:MAG TPA: thiamine pyrophosphate-binding protein [Firmicutes bacterium]|nr:thiamine pyrophosphate-binding protein [Bacillota bacterium]
MRQDHELLGGGLVARALKNEGVETIFSLSGGHINPIYNGCVTEGIRIIDTHHEQAAVHAAEGWARFTGRPGVAVATAGPGVVNALPGMAVASQSAVPLVLIGGRSSLVRRDMGAMQDMDQLSLMRPLTKWARQVYQVERIPEYVAAAFREAVSGRPGPVFLEIPVDIMHEKRAPEQVRFPENYYSRARPCAGEEDITGAVRLLTEAKRPLILAGSGVFWSGASDELTGFAESRRLPVYTRNMGRGTFPEDHELAGGFFPIGLMQADLVLILGTRLDWTVGYGRPPLLGTATKTIHVDIEASVIGQNRPATVGLVGDIKAILRQLERSLDPKKMQIEETWPQTIQVLRQAARESAFQGVSPVDGLIHPALLCRELGALLPPETMLVVDGGDIAGFAVLTMEARTPASLIWIGAFGHLGVGLPFALAGGLANPERPVVLLTGDGAFGLSAMEFDTAVRHEVPLTVVIANDGGWGQIRRGQRRDYGRTVGVELGVTRYDLIAETLGGGGAYVEKMAQLQPALEKALGSGGPSCINVKTDPDSGFSGMDLPWKIN